MRAFLPNTPVIEETARVATCLACGTTLERGGCPQCLGDLFPISGAPRSAVRPMSLPVPTVNHPLHIAATILTGGLWLVVYIPIVFAILIACIIVRDAAHASIRIARAISGRTGPSLAPHVGEADPLASLGRVARCRAT